MGTCFRAQTARNPRAHLARTVRQCRDLPGRARFHYPGAAGTPQAIGSADVNAYLREIAGDDFTAKDFRTRAGTVLAAMALADGEAAASRRRPRLAIAGRGRADDEAVTLGMLEQRIVRAAGARAA